jgi:hypothetical protein
LASVAGYTWTAGLSVVRHLWLAGTRRGVVVAAALLTLLSLGPVGGLVHYIYFDRSRLPDLERFILFELPTIGEVYDAEGKKGGGGGGCPKTRVCTFDHFGSAGIGNLRSACTGAFRVGAR